jgi:hypothetical protein
MPEQLKPLDAPECLLYLWVWFCELSNSRQYAEFGPMAISYTEIKAWADLTKNEPEAWEVEAIKKIDRVYLTEAMKK